MTKKPKQLWAMGLTTERDRIWLMFPNQPDVAKYLKAECPGPARWNGQASRWYFPLHWDTCTGIRRVANKLGADLKIGKDLTDWALIEKARQDSIPDVNSKEVVDLPVVQAEAPAIWKLMTEGDPEKGYPPRPYQTVGAAFLARNRSGLIADDPGLGKTVQAIAGIIESEIRGPILVVAPKAAAMITWPKELARWVPNDSVTILSSDIATTWNAPASTNRSKLVKEFAATSEGATHTRHWLITSPNYIRCRAQVDDYGNMVKPKVIQSVSQAVMELFDVEWSAIVVDESHQTLAGGSPGVGRSKWSAQRFGLAALDVKQDGLRIAMSGTPFRGQEAYLWGQLNWLRPDKFRAYWKWVEKHFDVWKDGYGMQIGRMVDEAGMYEEARNVMVRRTKAEVASDLPPKLYGGWPLDPKDEHSVTAVWLDMEPKQARAYNAIVKDAAVELEGGVLMVNGVLAELTRLKQFAGSYGKLEGEHFQPTLPSNKFNWLVEFLDERGITKDLEKTAPKVVVASQFSQLIYVFKEALEEMGIKAHSFTGDTNNTKRAAIEDDWQNNPGSEYRVLLLTTTAGGVSLTLDAADDLVLLDETWNPDDQTQVEDRLHRLSRIHQVVIWKLFSLGTIEEGIARNNFDKDGILRAIMDGQRGVEFRKQMYTGNSVAA